MRKISFLLLASALGLASTLSASAFAQSGADLQSARNLFREGLQLQNAGKFSDALDRFTRANEVVNAPTNMLHMAECHAALGHLVEAVEIYRAIQRNSLPSNAPPAFVQAVDQGREELKALEPRVPELKVDVTPSQVPTLAVTIDGQTLNPALVGVSRPINPGNHKVVASAPGYSRAEQSVDVKEKARQAITLTLISTGGVIYGPAGGATGAGPTTSSPYVTITGQPTGAVDKPPPYGAAPTDRPAPYTEPVRPLPPDTRSRSSLFIGPRVGFAIAAGKYVDQGLVSSMGDFTKPGYSVGVEGGIRFARIFYFSALFEYAKYGDKTVSSVDYSTHSTLLGAKFGINTNPDAFGFIADLGLGYREMSVDASVGRHSSATSGEFLVGMGLHVKVGDHVRLVPKVDVGVGSFGSGTSGTGLSSSTDDSTGHSFWTIGLGGYWDFDLDKRRSAAPPQLPPPP